MMSFIFLPFYVLGRQRDREVETETDRDRSSRFWFTSQMPTIAGDSPEFNPSLPRIEQLYYTETGYSVSYILVPLDA